MAWCAVVAKRRLKAATVSFSVFQLEAQVNNFEERKFWGIQIETKLSDDTHEDVSYLHKTWRVPPGY